MSLSNSVPRRKFIAGTAMLSFGAFISQKGWSQIQPAMVRPNVLSQDGKAMLKIYADAVGKMKQLPEGNPQSWTFQWYAHSVPSNTTKDDELKRIYPMPSANRDLASEVWSTCQAHGEDDPEEFFLPWHRLFVLYFERIIRTVSGKPQFVLPYWDYSAPNDATVRGVLPEEFRKPNDPVFGPLYVKNRNPGVNKGTPIQKGQPGDPLGLGALSQCTYEPKGAEAGFCQKLDDTLHGSVHVLVGDNKNMGQVPWAGRDPIFWLHHCNIDRIWASWNAGGRANATMSQAFVFADGDGSRVVGNVADVMDTSKLGYSYAELAPVPDCPHAAPLALAAAAPEPEVAHASSKSAPTPLSDKPTKIPLTPSPPAAGQPPKNLHEKFLALKPSRRLYLVIKGLKVEAAPGVLYHVYLDLPEGSNEEDAKKHYVGDLNFFNALGHAGHTHKEGSKQSKKFRSFDITNLVQALTAKKLLAEKPVVTIAPSGQPAADAKPVVGEISIVEQ